MYKNQHSAAITYTLDEAANIMGKNRTDLESLIRQKRLGFEMTDYGPVVTNSQIATYYLGGKPHSIPDYVPSGPSRKPRKHYPKARSRR